MNRTLLAAIAIAAALIGAPAIAEYPEKPVSFIVPWPPGDLEDVLTRLKTRRWWWSVSGCHRSRIRPF